MPNANRLRGNAGQRASATARRRGCHLKASRLNFLRNWPVSATLG
jgi:hypothetical protein